MSERFKSINADGDPGDQNPTLAENYRLRTPENLYPGDIVHPIVYSAIARDEISQKLYINGGVEFGPDADDPADYKDRFGIMRIYQAAEDIEDDESMYDGYLVDIRFIRPEQIDTMDLFDDDGVSYDDEDMPFGEPLPVLGYIYLDADGDAAYNGRDDPKIIETAMYFRDVIDTVRCTGDDEDADDSISGNSEAAERDQAKPLRSAPGGKQSETDTLPEPPSQNREL